MANISDLLNQAATGTLDTAELIPAADYLSPKAAGIPAMVAAKKASVAAAAESKQLSLGGGITPYQLAIGQQTGLGADSASSKEADLRNLTPSQLYAQYGNAAGELLRARAQGSRELLADASQPYNDPLRASGDLLTAGILGFGNALGGLGALGLGVLDEDLGTGAANLLREGTELVQDNLYSDRLQASKRVLAGKDLLSQRDNQAQYEKDLESDGELMAGLKQIGRGVMASVDNATDDRTTLLEGGANALGSLFAAGPVSKGLRALGTALGAGTGATVSRAGALVDEAPVVSAVSALGSKAAVPAAIGGLEAGGAYQQITTDILGRSHEQLMAESPMYQELIDQGLSQEEAKVQVASRTGLLSAAITAPAAALTGTLVSRFEADPLAAQAARQVAGNLLREPIEEGIQGGLSQTAQNLAEQQIANENQTLTEGVGEQVGTGALYGLGMTAAVQAPAAAKYATLQAGRAGLAGAKAVGNSLAARADALQAENEKASPIADEVILSAAQEAQASAPQAEVELRTAVESLPDEVKPAASAYVDKLLSASQFSADEVPASLVPVVQGSTNRVEAIQKLADQVSAAEENSREQLTAGLTMYELLAPYDVVVNSDPAAIDALPVDSQARKIIDEYDRLMANVQNTPKVRNTLATVQQALDKQTAQPITEQSLATEQGQQDARNVVTAAALAPDKANLEQVQQVLLHASQGRIQLSPQQKAALDTSLALLKAAKDANDQALQLGLDSKADRVTRNIQNEQGEKGPSALQYAQGIIAAWKANNTDLAADRLAHLGELVQNQQNKVMAINSHFAGGDLKAPPVGYQALSQSRTWYDAPKGMFVNTLSQQSIQQVQQIAGEARFLADVYNGLVSAFPDLQGQHAQVTPLDAYLLQPAVDIVAEAKAQTRKAKPAPVPVAQQAAPAPAALESVEQASVQPDAPSVADEIQPTTEAENAIPARIRNLSDEQLNDRLNTVSINDPDFTLLDAEMNRREDQAHAENEAEAEREAAEVSAEQAAKQQDAEPVEEEEQDQPETSEVGEAVPEPQGMDEAFPNLISMVPNFFKQAFRLSEEQTTRTFGVETPIAFLQRAFASSASLRALVGDKLQGDLNADIAAAYRELLDNGQQMVTQLNRQLADFVGSKKIMQRLAEGQEPNRWVNGKLLNITEEQDGGLVYNQELVENAVLAGLNWLLNTDQYGAIVDTKDVAELLGMTEEAVGDDLVERFSQGMSALEAKRSLAQKIRQYWGLATPNSGLIGYQEGIPESMAAEILRVLVSSGALVEDKIHLTEADGLPPLDDGKPHIKDFLRLVPAHTIRDPQTNQFPDDPFQVMRSMPAAIEQAVLLQPEDVHFIGEGNLPPVAPKQLRNPLVDNTVQQKQAIENEQATPYFINPFMTGFYTALGKAGVLRLFGSGNLDNQVLNDNHRQSLEGSNRSLVAAFDHLMGLVSEVRNQGDLDTPIHYAFNITRVQRLQMLGKHNPQANKLVREAILPTRSSLDLSRETHADYRRFALGMAQALGIKVHKESAKDALTKVKGLLTGSLAPSVAALQNWLLDYTADTALDPKAEIPESVIETLLTNFKVIKEPLTPVALHALMEYARYQAADGPGKSQFSTQLYLEADGMTNGPINAMVLFTTGLFDANWIRNIAKGGLFFNRPGETANSYNEFTDKDDLYQASTDALKQNLINLQGDLKGNSAARQQMDHLFNLMDLFFAGDLSFDAKTNTITLKRGIAKNPLTITIYGSGAGGIAGKLTKTLTDAIYERMSQVASARATDPQLSIAEAMFGAQSASLEEAQAKMQRFQAGLNSLAHKRAKSGKNGLFFESQVLKQKRNGFDPQTFTLFPEEAKNIQSNMLHLFVNPMRDAIEETVGKPLMDTAQLLRKATQVQSIILEQAFQTEVQAAMDKKAATDPTWQKGDFLTRGELQGIYKKLEHLAPLVQTETQTFFIAGSQSTDVDASDFGRGFDDSYRSPAFIYGPTNAGVAGIPFLNIGAGDAQMMQNIATAEDGPTGTLKIFDGMNMPLDQIESGSQVANRSVYESWTNNPLKAVYDSYLKFISNADLLAMEEPARKALTRALLPQEFWDTQVSAQELKALAEALAGQLETAQQQIEARHRVLQRVPVSVDQMAAAASPYFHQGDLILSGTDPDSLAAQLNVFYQTELDTIQQAESKKRWLSDELKAVAEKDATGAYVLHTGDLNNLAVQLPSEQQAVLNEVLGSLVDQGYTVVMGGVKQLGDYAEQHGHQRPTPDQAISQQISGYTSIGDKTIYLIQPSSETLVHELVHASTFELVLAHYQGRSSNQVKQSIYKIEQLMDQFLNLELTQLNPQAVQAYQDAKAAIEGHDRDDSQSKAAALNEFMAWALSNEHLIRLGQRTRASKLGRISQAVVGFLKQLLGIPQTVGKDLFSNLLFNTSVLIHNQPNLQQRLTTGLLFQNSLYGNSDRLTAINEAFVKAVGRYLQEPVEPGVLSPKAAVDEALQISYRIGQSFQAQGFRMSMQEATTFDSIVSALATEAKLDANALAAAQQLYAHVTKQLTVEHFMRDPQGNNPADRYYAQQKFDAIMGKHLVELDIKGRSTLLPAFLGLAIVNDEFREILAGMDLPKTLHNTAGTLDAVLENAGNQVMDKLSARMAGTAKSITVQGAIDALSDKIADTVQQRESYLDQLASKSGGLVDRANQVVLEGLDQLSDTLLEKSKAAEANDASKLTRLTAGFGAGIAAVVSEKVGQAVAQDVMKNLNQRNVWEPFHTLINDLVGRTQSNASVYDMIKGVRSMVQQTRQQFREHLPELIAEKFSRELDATEWSSLHRSMGKTDLASLSGYFSQDAILALVSDVQQRDRAVLQLENYLNQLDPAHFPLLQQKMQQLAGYMNTGKPGRNLLRNALAISNLYGEQKQTGWAPKDETFVAAVDQLTTLYALQGLNPVDQSTMAALVQGEAEGLKFTLSYLIGQRAEEQRKAQSGKAKVNAYKGWIPSEVDQGVSLIVADDTEHADLLAKSYVWVAPYNGSSADPSKASRSYYFAPVASRPVFEQGIVQNVRQTVSGVDAASGYTVGMLAGRYTEPALVKAIGRRLGNERAASGEHLLPVYDDLGQLIALERSLDPIQLERLGTESDLAKVIGQWRGRQVEEASAGKVNHALVDALKAMYDKDLAASLRNQKQYVDLFGSLKDPVLEDALKLLTPETLAYIKSVFGEEFYVRKDLLNDALGYRSASIGDAWTGTSRWSPETQKRVQQLAMSVFGNDAYRLLVNAEKTVQNVVSDARVLIVVKSVVVPITNLMSNVLQLVGRGVPILDIMKAMPKKTAEIEAYTKSRIRQIEAEAELRAATGNIQQERRLKAEIQSITDAHKRLSIWPLIEAGEFSSISDAGLTRSEIQLTSGRLQAYIEGLAQKLPQPLSTLGRYALVTKDTALFQGLQKAVEYGDFLGKAVLYDDLTLRQGKTRQEALGRITEEFVNYDRLSGRFRGTLENLGLLWFYNFKIRSAKVALSMLRNNPVHALLASLAPAPTLFGSVGSPITDNVFSKLADGSLDYSVGPSQGLESMMLNPWINLAH